MAKRVFFNTSLAVEYEIPRNSYPFFEHTIPLITRETELLSSGTKLINFLANDTGHLPDIATLPFLCCSFFPFSHKDRDVI